MRDPLVLQLLAFNGWTGSGRSKHIKAFGCADGMNPEHVGVVADHDQAAQPVDAGYDGNAAGRLLR